MEEATITKWHVAPGSQFRAAEILYELETEKVTQEIEAPADGTLLEISVPEGGIAKVDEVVCVIDAQPVSAD